MDKYIRLVITLMSIGMLSVCEAGLYSPKKPRRVWTGFEQDKPANSASSSGANSTRKPTANPATGPAVKSGSNGKVSDNSDGKSSKKEGGESKKIQSEIKRAASGSEKHQDWSLPKGYELQNVPGDGLCGYWAILTALKISKSPKKESIEVYDSEVVVLANEIADYIKHLAYPEEPYERSADDYWMLWQIKYYTENCGNEKYETIRDFLEKLRDRSVQMDHSLFEIVARCLKVRIYVDGDEKRDEYKTFGTSEYVPEGNTLRIYYSGKGNAGHYQVIAPKLEGGKQRKVHFKK